MIQEEEILNDIKDIKSKTELLANPLYNDYGGSYFWGEINEDICKIINNLEKEITRLYALRHKHY